jgi:predicted metal-dependent hydrolase
MDARLRKGIRLFNAGNFFASHEVLEDFYLHTDQEQDKPFLEGIIELSVAFRLYTDFGEVQGPVRMIHQALIRLEHYQPTYLRIRVNELIGALEEWTKQVMSADGQAPSVHDQIPKIRTRMGFFTDER